MSEQMSNYLTSLVDIQEHVHIYNLVKGYCYCHIRSRQQCHLEILPYVQLQYHDKEHQFIHLLPSRVLLFTARVLIRSKST